MFKKIFTYNIPLIMLLLSAGGGIQAQQQNRPASNNIPAPVAAPLPLSYPNGMKVNFVRTWDALAPITDPGIVTNSGYQDVKQTTQYVDGLGRPLQTVSRQITPAAKDMVAPVVYDEFGREVYNYLPYVSAENNGLFKNDAFDKQRSFMQGQFTDEQVYYGKIDFEASPRNRVLKSMASGNSWAGSNRGVGMDYLVNAVNDGVRIWNIASDPLTYNLKDVSTNIPFNPATPYYSAGELYKNATTDEAGNMVVEYKDKEGQVVLRKVQSGNPAVVVPAPPGTLADVPLTGLQSGVHQATNSITLEDGFVSDVEFTAEIVGGLDPSLGYVGFLCTYYVYDDLNQLRFVIPPKAVAQLIVNNWQFTSDIINELCFRYEYDARKRMIAKKVPGANWVYLVYDVRDRLVFTQDGNQHKNGQWMATLYDGLNRPVLTGIMNWNSGTATNLQLAVTTQTTTDGVMAIEGISVTRNPIPSGSTFVALTKTYYDKYSWTNKTFTAAYNSYLDAGSNAHVVTMPSQAQTQTTGLVTGSQVRIITDPNNLAAGNWLTTVNFYDDRSRVIQVYNETHKGTDIITNRYDFTGKVVSSYLDHTNPTGIPASVHVKTNIEYDHAGRLKEMWKTLNDNPAKKALIVKNEYDELGQLKVKELGHKKELTGNYTSPTYDPIEKLNYDYNIRGWMTGINKDYSNAVITDRWFGMELNYDKGFQLNQYNGNIAGTKWRSKGDGERRAYGYTYDKVNRIMGADFTQFDGSSYIDHAIVNFDMQMGNGFDPALAYDENGNILAMKQIGFKLNNSLVIDDLHYDYYKGGNKLRLVTDGGVPQTGASLGDYQDNHTIGNIYGYDNNGNLITDKNKKWNGVPDVDQVNGAITYNQLNLPWQIKVDDGNKGTITYVYDAEGTKLQKIVFEKGATVVYNNSNVISEISTTTSYVGGMVYESKAYSTGSLSSLNYTDRLQFIGQEEGRIRYIAADGTTPAKYEYDYFVKDHLGNVRLVLTEEQKQDIYPAATLENVTYNNGTAISVEDDFYNIDATKVVDQAAASGIPVYQNNNGIYNNNYYSNATANSARLYKLNASGNTPADKTGLRFVLKVLAGDAINIFGKSYHKMPVAGYTSSVNGVIVSELINGFAGSPLISAKGVTGSQITGQPGFPTSLNQLIGNQPDQSTNRPKAAINWIILDEQFKWVSGGFDMVGAAVNPDGTFKTHDNSTIPTINIPKNGYVYVYCSNESQYNVFFDNLQVIHTKGPLLEETHYYPFGLTMAGISSKAIGRIENKYKFNDGTELDNKEFTDGSGLDLYSTEFRSYDPQIGRFLQIDDLADWNEGWSPYVFANNNPILLNDPLGLSSDTTTLPTVTVTPSGSGALAPVCYTCTVSINPAAAVGGAGSLAAYILTRESSISGSNEKVDGMELLLTGMALQDENPEYQLEHTVVEKRKLYEFWEADNYIGKNIYGGDVHNNMLTGSPPDVGFSRIKSIRTLFRGSWIKRLKALPTLDGTRKVHGVLPKLRELHKYSVDELKIFLEELKISVVERKRLNGILGADPGHGRRVGEEHALIRKIEKILENISL
jgi:RHS repeat-associated protein